MKGCGRVVNMAVFKDGGKGPMAVDRQGVTGTDHPNVWVGQLRQ